MLMPALPTGLTLALETSGPMWMRTHTWQFPTVHRLVQLQQYQWLTLHESTPAIAVATAIAEHRAVAPQRIVLVCCGRTRVYSFML